MRNGGPQRVSHCSEQAIPWRLELPDGIDEPTLLHLLEAVNITDELHYLPNTPDLNATKRCENEPSSIVSDMPESKNGSHIDVSLNPAVPASSHASTEDLEAKSNTPSPPKKGGNIAITTNIRKALLDAVVHLAPILITAMLLTLNFKLVYFTEVEHVQMILNALQFCAKLHEMMMVASLSLIVICRLRRELVKPEAPGVALGFLTSPYELSSIALLFSTQFRAAWTTSRHRNLNGLSLGSWIILGVLLVAVVGPSSAIVMLPSPGWWDSRHPLKGSPPKVYTNISRIDMWPQKITTDLLPSGCLTSSESYYCPSAGYREISSWVDGNMKQRQSSNVTIANDDGSSLVRYLTGGLQPGATTWNLTDGESVASTVSVRQARDIVAVVQWEIESQQPYINTQGPSRIEASLSGGSGVMKPLVHIQCGINKVTDQAEYLFRHDKLSMHPFNNATARQSTWVVPGDVISEVLSNPDEIGTNSFAWVDMQEYDGKPSIGAVFAFKDPTPDDVLLLPCVVDARWVPVSIWLEPESDFAVRQNSTDPIALYRDIKHGKIPVGDPIHIDTDWAASLNPGGSTRQVLADLSQTKVNIPDMLQHWGYNLTDDNTNKTYFAIGPPGPYDNYAYLVGSMLGLYLTDALARVNSDITSALFVEEFSAAKPYSQTYDTENVNSIESDVDEWASQEIRNNWEGWSEMQYRIRRSGYGWRIQGTTMYIATSILILQALIGLGHITTTMKVRHSSKSWSVMTEMLTLAMNSMPSERLFGTAAGIDDPEVWKEMFLIREVDDHHLELVIKGSERDAEASDVRTETKYW